MKVKSLIIVLMLLMITSSLAFANEITLSFNGQTVENEDTIILKDGILYASVSKLFDPMGIHVNWLDKAKLVSINDGDKYVSFKVDDSMVIINNEVDNAPNATFVENGVSYVPFEYLMAFFPETYTYDSQFLKVDIMTERLDPSKVIAKSLAYTDEDVLWLARIVDVEARDGSVIKKIAVANVVLNRVKDERFPNTVYDVIYASGQFPPAHKSGFATSEPSMNSFIAVKRALEGENNVETCLYFNNRPFSSKANDFYKNIEGDYFYY